MITVEFRFPGGLYHATPWGHHVNEGLVEWPPSPWRLIRAMLSTGFTKLGWNEVPSVGRMLFERLASALPSYALPQATLAHSRHYMPISPNETTLVLDAWANVNDGVLRVRWPIELTAPERALFAELLENLGYLGRAESWVTARLAEDAGDAWPEHATEPVNPIDAGVRRGFEQISLLAPVASATYHLWREREIGSLPKGAAGNRALKGYPVDLLACLTGETAWLREHGWSQPPGSRVALYWRSSGALATTVAPSRRARMKNSAVDAMLLALATPSRNPHALPPIERSLPQAELLHRAVVSALAGAWVPELVGKDEARKPLAGHQHAHMIPLDLDEDGRLDHVFVWAPAGLSDIAQSAIAQVKRTYAKGVADIGVSVAGRGSLASFAAIVDQLGAPLRRLIAPAKVWTSRTPFVAPRFVKPRGKNSFDGQIRAELESRGFPSAEVEILDPFEVGFRHFVVHRRRGAGPPQAMVWRVRLRFDEVVQGPISLGFGSHFGLGSFEAHGALDRDGSSTT